MTTKIYVVLIFYNCLEEYKIQEQMFCKEDQIVFQNSFRNDIVIPSSLVIRFQNNNHHQDDNLNEKNKEKNSIHFVRFLG